MKTATKTLEFANYFNLLEEQLIGKFQIKFGEHIMVLNNSLAKGTVKAIEIRKNKFFFEFNLTINKNFSVTIPHQGYNAINFIYSQKGLITQSFGDSNKMDVINRYQTAIIANKKEDTILHFKANTQIRFVLISVCMQENTMASPMISKVHALFSSKMKNDKFTYFGSINLKISEQINTLNEITETGIVRKLLVEGTVQLILGMEIRHHKEDIENKTPYTGSLSRKELIIIQELGDKIKNNVAEQYNIEMLMDETGISAAKLQEGFKLLYNRTVTDYIKNLRVEESERLFKTTDLNVSQIVYTIGFSSRSYFSKIFRQKYNCSPNEYANKCRVSAKLI